jgi:tetrahydromethanopterin S-methyltransferase subunit H
MFSFIKEQKIYEISTLKIGGQPGNLPTVLFGGFFFKGEPNLKSAKQKIKKIYLLSNKTGNPFIPDFFIKKEENLEKIINFILKEIPKNKPFSVDIIEPDLKIKTLELLSDKNLLKRTVYNSIHIGTTNEERQVLKKHRPNMAIIVAFNPKDKSPDGKIEVLENGANLLDVGLIELAKQVGIKKILIDTAAMAPGDNSGAAISAIPVIKEEYGLPVGCAIHNVVEKSTWLKNFKSSRKIVDAASNTNIPLFGGDFAIYGSVENSEIVFPIISWQDILISEYAQSYFGITPDKNHPRRILFK